MKFTGIYKCSNYEVEHKGKKYILSDEWDDFGGGNITVTGVEGENVTDEVENSIINAYMTKRD